MKRTVFADKLHTRHGVLNIAIGGRFEHDEGAPIELIEGNIAGGLWGRRWCALPTSSGEHNNRRQEERGTHHGLRG